MNLRKAPRVPRQDIDTETMLGIVLWGLVITLAVGVMLWELSRG